jgi:asparagine synthase (glutamine-hydrolysing)
MCGFIGVISNKHINNSSIKKSNNFLSCRGPDDHKSIESKLDNKNIHFSFHRLSIVDLSEEASQPMASKRFNSEIMFNGEIYNHAYLRNELESQGVKFNTSHSDTETLLAGLSLLGNKFLEKIEGQFSIAFLNKDDNTLTLIRDRLGQKPLYYTLNKDELIFSSNFKSVLSYKKNFNIDQEQISTFLELGCVPSPNTLDKEIFKLEPGELIEISLNDLVIINKIKYWDIKNFLDDKEFNKNVFFKLFQESVEKRLVSDVPIANLLSGGIDSTSIIKSLHEQGVSKINTYSIINKNKEFDESFWSDKVVDKYKTNHKFKEIDGKNLASSVDPVKVIESFDEPYSDPSIFPSFMIYDQISKDYKVAISGDGGDELLGGYEKIHFSIKKGYFPLFMMRLIKKIIPPKYGTGGSLHSISSSPEFSFLSLTTDTKLINLLSLKSTSNFEERFMKKDVKGLKKLLISDYNFYFSELMLLKVDRMSMANSLEVRSPFLDHKLVEYIVSTNLSFFDVNNPKALLKEYLNTDFDLDFIDRKKMGFVFDLENWIYNNKDTLTQTILESKLFKIKNVEMLFRKKTRINAIRILKIFTISLFIKSYNSISTE